MLLKWHELKDKISNVFYLERLSLSSVHLPFSIKPDTGRIEESFRSLASKVHPQSKGLRGRARINFLNKTRSFHVYINELLNVSSLNAQLEKCEEEKNQFKRQLQVLDNKCEELVQDLLSEKRKVRNLEAESEGACQENNELTEYLDFLEGTMVCSSCSVNLENTGRPINEVGKHQRS